MFLEEELRQIAAVLEVLNIQVDQGENFCFVGGSLDFYFGDSKQGSIVFVDGAWQFEPEPQPCISCGELDEYKEKHCRQQEEIWRLKQEIKHLRESNGTSAD